MCVGWPDPVANALSRRSIAAAWSRLRSGAPGEAGYGHSIGLSIGLFVATFLLTRQTQIPLLNGLGAPWALLVVIAFLRWRSALIWLVPMSLYGALSVLTSLLLGHDPGNALRFFVITIGTLLAFHVKPIAISAPLTLMPLAAQAALLIAISVGLGLSQDDELATLTRSFVLETTWGDIYSFDGIYYRVQLIGNALMPLLFLISLWRYKQGGFYRFMAVLSLLGVVAAGNLTYSLVAGIAIVIRGWRLALSTMVGRSLAALILVVAIVLAWNATNEMLERKFDGSDSSMGIRFDQVDVALDVWRQSPTRFLFGTGLGTSFPDGRERNYSEFQYIELQSLYLLVQLGLVGMLIYLATLAIGAHLFLNADGRCVFWLYVLSGFTNPTILDANQIIATVLLVCLFPRPPADLSSTSRGSLLSPTATPPSRGPLRLPISKV